MDGCESTSQGQYTLNRTLARDAHSAHNSALLLKTQLSIEINFKTLYTTKLIHEI